MFAINLAKLDTKKIIIEDKLFLHRIINVLRLSLGEQVILFNNQEHCLCQVKSFDKKSLIFDVLSIQKNIKLSPKIKLFLPILKKEAFEEVLYSAAQLGVSEIVPIITNKSLKSYTVSDRDYRVMISACEQSKQFILPQIFPTLLFNDMLKNISTTNNIFLDPAGTNIETMLKLVKNNQEISLLFGPEGDLSFSEKELLTNFQKIKLTQPILKSEQAAALALGLIRSA